MWKSCRRGAIEKFDIDEDYNIEYSTIGDTKAISICESGLIDIVGALVRKNKEKVIELLKRIEGGSRQFTSSFMWKDLYFTSRSW